MRCFDGFPKYNSGIRLANLKKLDCEYAVDEVEVNSCFCVGSDYFYLYMVEI